NVLDRKPFELTDHFPSALVKLKETRTLDLVLAPNLFHQQFRISNYLERFMPMLEGVVERSQQSAVFRIVVRLVAEILAQSRDFASGLVGDDNSVASGARIATRAAINVGDQERIGLRLLGKQATGFARNCTLAAK